jgi:hypothetical protein
MTPGPFEIGRSRLAWAATGLLPAAWFLLLFNLLSARSDEVLGPRALPLEYAASRSETLTLELMLGVIEVVLLTLVLQPWRRSPLWPRALAAFVLFLPWTLLAFAIGLHAGLMSEAHTMWRLGIVGVIGGVILISGLRSFIHRGRAAR